MRTFCVILLLGVVTYVHGANECAKYAVKVGKSGEGSSSEQQVIPLDQFLAKEISSFKTVMASRFTASHDACTAPTHGENCGGVEYSRKLVKKYKNDAKLSNVEFETIFIGYNTVKKIANEYRMHIGGHDDEYYIFKHSETNPDIKTYKIPKPEGPIQEEAAIIDHAVRNVIISEFALFRYNPGKYYIYTTCDLLHAWVTCENDVEFDSEDSDLTRDIQALKDFATEKGISLQLNEINTAFTKPLSDYVKGFYSTSP